MLSIKIMRNEESYIYCRMVLSYLIIIGIIHLRNMKLSDCYKFCDSFLGSIQYNFSIKSNIVSYLSTDSLVTNDLSNWMGNLPDRLKTIPFYQLSIPGSHDSITYTITSKSKFAPDAEEWLRKISFIGCPLRAFIARWSRTQEADTTTQLENGIRYLDYRLATKVGTRELFICHGLYGENVINSFRSVKTFITQHPGEIVILDIQHFYKFEYIDHEYLLENISKIFGDSLLHYDSDEVHKYSLNYLTHKNKYQIIIIYRARDIKNPYWNIDSFPTPWPNTTDSKILFEKLDNGLAQRDVNTGYVSQCIYTPDGKLIVKHVISNLKTTCAAKLMKPMLQWLSHQHPGVEGRLNVTIADFVGMDDWIFTKNVIMLNLKI